MKILVLVVLLFTLSSVGAGESVDNQAQEKFMARHSHMLVLLRDNPDNEEFERSDVVQFVNRKTATSYLVTKENHPAHPAIVRRRLVEENGDISVHTQSSGGGSAEALKA